MLQPEHTYPLNLSTTSFLYLVTYVVCIHRRIKESESVVYAAFQLADSEGLIAKNIFLVRNIRIKLVISFNVWVFKVRFSMD